MLKNLRINLKNCIFAKKMSKNMEKSIEELQEMAKRSLRWNAQFWYQAFDTVDLEYEIKTNGDVVYIGEYTEYQKDYIECHIDDVIEEINERLEDYGFEVFRLEWDESSVSAETASVVVEDDETPYCSIVDVEVNWGYCLEVYLRKI